MIAVGRLQPSALRWYGVACISVEHAAPLDPRSKTEELIERLLQLRGGSSSGQAPPTTSRRTAATRPVRDGGTGWPVGLTAALPTPASLLLLFCRRPPAARAVGPLAALSVQAEAKTPRTSRKAAAAATPLDKAALLRAAASIPLPGSARAERDDEAEEGEEGEQTAARRSSGGSQPRTQAKTPAAGTASGSGGGKQGRRPPRSGLASPRLWLLLLTAVAAAGLAAVAVPYCQQQDCLELARNLPELAPEAAAAGYSQARVQALAAADALREQWQALVRVCCWLGIARLLTQR